MIALEPEVVTLIALGLGVTLWIKLKVTYYLRCKTITSQNVPSKAQIKNFFISQKNYVLFSRYSSFCIFNHSMIYQINDVTMMSISTWDKVHFLIYLLNDKSWSLQTWSVYRYTVRWGEFVRQGEFVCIQTSQGCS